MTAANSFNIWEGIYASFPEITNGDAFTTDIWQNKQINKLNSNIKSLHTPESIPPITQVQEYILPIVIAMLQKAQQQIDILDFGGGLGNAFLTLQGCLPKIELINFDVIEGSSTCASAKKLLSQYKNLNYYNDITDTKPNYHVTHFGSSLQYIGDWKNLLQTLATKTTKYLVFSDLMAGDIPTFASRQYFYGQYIPTWFWNLWEFVEVVNQFGFDLIYHAKYKGIYLDKRSELPMNNFPEEHRLKNSCHLIFCKNENTK